MRGESQPNIEKLRRRISSPKVVSQASCGPEYPRHFLVRILDTLGPLSPMKRRHVPYPRASISTKQLV